MTFRVPPLEVSEISLNAVEINENVRPYLRKRILRD
jgi:hypothetical protein